MAVLLLDVDLDVVVVPVQERRRDLVGVTNLRNGDAAPQPAGVFVDELADRLVHGSEHRMLDCRHFLHAAMRHELAERENQVGRLLEARLRGGHAHRSSNPST